MELIEAAALDAAQLDAAETLYATAFPAELRAPFADLFADDLLVLAGDGVRGLIVSRVLGPTGWIFVRYFAVATRGRGDGSRLWQLAARRWADAGHTRILLDVEDPAESGITTGERIERERRIVFYQRLGLRVLPVDGYRPPQPDGRPHPLLLLTTDLVPVDDLVHAVYRYRYGLTP